MVKNDPKLKIEKSFRHPTCIRGQNAEFFFLWHSAGFGFPIRTLEMRKTDSE